MPLMRKKVAKPRRTVVLRAAGMKIDTTNRNQTRELSLLRQAWQTDAWRFREQIPELRFATRFVANAISRVSFLGAAVNPNGDDPILFAKKPDGISEELRAAVDDEMSRLPIFSGARFGGRISENFEYAGECWLHGYTDEWGQEAWEILSVDEVRLLPDGTIQLVDGRGRIIRTIGPDEEMMRLWVPDPRFKEFADAPMRSMIELCMEIVLNGRERRAASRSRAAANGILLIPNGMTLSRVTTEEDEDEPDSNSFVGDLMAGMLAPINNEGDAGAVVPMVIQGDSEDLKGVRQVSLEREDSETLLAKLDNALGRLATGLDMPADLINGLGDTNHWTGWLIDQSTYRYHLDPRCRTIADSLTQGYLWPQLRARGQFSLEEITSVQVWFDAGNLTENPSRGTDAKDAYDRGAIGPGSLRDALGFTEDDAPSDEELFRMIAVKAGMDPQTAALLIQRMMDPSQPLLIPTRETVGDKDGAPPLDDPSEPDNETPAGPGVAPSSPTPATQPTGAPIQASASRILSRVLTTEDRAWLTEQGWIDPVAAAELPVTATDLAAVLGVDRTQAEAMLARSTIALTAAVDTGDDFAVDLFTCRQLMEIERTLRDRILTAADGAIMRALERAGARIRSHANGYPDNRARITGAEVTQFGIILGADAVYAMGLDLPKILAGAWDALHGNFTTWTQAAIRSVAGTILKLLRVDKNSARGKAIADRVEQQMGARLDKGWARLEKTLNAATERHLFHPLADQEPGEVSGTLLPPGAVRAALSEVGGSLPGTGGFDDNGRPLHAGTPSGGLALGQTTSEVMEDNGAVGLAHEWVYGITPRQSEFEPHAELDGTRFIGWEDPKLSTVEWPRFAWVGPFFEPGDHPGCMCDYMPVFAVPVVHDLKTGLQSDSPTIRNERRLVATDDAAGRTGTTAQRTVAERERIQALQQRYLDRNEDNV